MAQMENKRIAYIDELKGFAILLVVLGHVIQYCYAPNDFDNNVLFRLIYSFHMPLFFVISGFVSALSSAKTLSLTFVRKNLLYLIVPFIVWSLLNWIILKDYNIFEVLIKPDRGLWFLWTLFWVRCFFVLSQHVAYKIKINTLYIHIFTLVFLFGMCVLLKGILSLGFIYRFYIYYVIGSYLAKYKDIVLGYKNYPQILVVATPIFMIASMYWYRVPEHISPLYSEEFRTVISSSAYSYATALLGCFICFLYFCNRRSERGFLVLLGHNTFGIYAIHLTVIKLLTRIPAIYTNELFHTSYGVLVCLGILLSLSFLLILILNPFNFPRRLLLGK